MTRVPGPGVATAEPVPALARRISLFFLVAYGVGDIVGSGIYGTIGVAAGALGNAVWLAFLASMLAAVFTGLTYASVSSRYPRAAGAAYVTNRAFGHPLLSYSVGLAVAASGLTSIATAANVFSLNLSVLLGGTPVWILKVAFLLFLTAVNLRGIRESMWTNLICTVIEVGGLLFVIFLSARFWGRVDYFETPTGPGGAGLSASLLLSGAVLTFYSFVGFEDMINVSEEVKNPRRNMPWGLVLALGIAALFYIAVSVSAVSVVPYRELADKNLGAPFAQITRRVAPWLSPLVYTFITLFAVANTALLNFVMGSRLVYGMARDGLLPAPLGRVHGGRRTPHVAILSLLGLALALALAGNIASLARATAVLLLAVFAVVNLALFVLMLRPHEPRGGFEIPRAFPLIGLALCLILLAHAKAAELRISGILVLAILVLYRVLRPKGVPPV